jgi:hypothetical protein
MGHSTITSSRKQQADGNLLYKRDERSFLQSMASPYNQSRLNIIDFWLHPI